jgi:hypothetical protein
MERQVDLAVVAYSLDVSVQGLAFAESLIKVVAVEQPPALVINNRLETQFGFIGDDQADFLSLLQVR